MSGKFLTTIIAFALSASVAHAQQPTKTIERLAKNVVENPTTYMLQDGNNRAYRLNLFIEAPRPEGDPIETLSCNAYLLFEDRKPYLTETEKLSPEDAITGTVQCVGWVSGKENIYTSMNKVGIGGKIDTNYIEGPKKANDSFIEMLAR